MSEGEQPRDAGYYTWKAEGNPDIVVYIDCPFNNVYVDDVERIGHVDELEGEFIYLGESE